MTTRHEHTMDDFREEMRRRGVYKTPSPHGTRARYARRCRCAACRAANTAYYHTLKASKLIRATPSATDHGNTITKTVPCGVHPLHDVRVRANGTRTGCPMCEMQIEDLCRSLGRGANNERRGR